MPYQDQESSRDLQLIDGIGSILFVEWLSAEVTDIFSTPDSTTEVAMLYSTAL